MEELPTYRPFEHSVPTYMRLSTQCGEEWWWSSWLSQQCWDWWWWNCHSLRVQWQGQGGGEGEGDRPEEQPKVWVSKQLQYSIIIRKFQNHQKCSPSIKSGDVDPPRLVSKPALQVRQPGTKAWAGWWRCGEDFSWHSPPAPAFDDTFPRPLSRLPFSQTLYVLLYAFIVGKAPVSIWVHMDSLHVPQQWCLVDRSGKVQQAGWWLSVYAHRQGAMPGLLVVPTYLAPGCPLAPNLLIVPAPSILLLRDIHIFKT